MSKLVSKMVKVAFRITDRFGLLEEVVHYPWIGAGTFSEPLFDAPTIRKAIVEEKTRTRRLIDGTEIVQKASVIFLQPFNNNGSTDREDPIDSRDKIVLPSGRTGPILAKGPDVVNPDTHGSYVFEVILG